MMVEKHMSPIEIKTVRWIEKILTPLLLAGILTLSTCMYNTTQAVDRLQVAGQREEVFHVDTKEDIEAIKIGQQGMEVRFTKVETKQEAIIEDVSDIKEQNKEILDILREMK